MQRRKRLAFTAVVAICLSSLSLAQSPPGDARGHVDGRVLTPDGTAFKPVRRATVTLVPMSAGPRVSAVTDAGGRFALNGVPRGSYRVTVERTGFVQDPQGQNDLVVEPSQRVQRDVRLLRGAAIEGRIVYADGSPAATVRVAAVTLANGSRKPLRTSMTDDRGAFRLHTLPPGEYWVQVDSPSSAGGNRALTIPAGNSPAGLIVGQGANLTGIDAVLPDTTPAALTGDANGTPTVLSLGSQTNLTSAKRTSAISGRILAFETAQPLVARVMLSMPATGLALAVRTDASGAFTFPRLPAGAYRITASAAGRVPTSYGQATGDALPRLLEVAEGEEVSEANIRLAKYAVIAGSVTDEYGDPAPDVAVVPMTFRATPGGRRLAPSSIGDLVAVTDDLGNYRCPGLLPGNYFIAGITGAFASLQAPGGLDPTYFPGYSASDVTGIALAPGDSRDGVSFSMAYGGATSIRGRVMDPAGGTPARAEAWLVTRGGASIPFLMARAPVRDGRFAFDGVPAGNYVLQVYARTDDSTKGKDDQYFASMTVTAPAEHDLDIQVTQGHVIPGRIILDTDAIAEMPPDAERVRLTAFPVTIEEGPVTNLGRLASPVADNWTFQFRNIFGPVSIRTSLPDSAWALKGITYRGDDVTGAPLVPRGDAELEVTISNKTGRVECQARDSKGRPIDDFTVVVFLRDALSEDSDAGIRRARSSQHGRAWLDGLLPGRYTLIAWPSEDVPQQISSQYLRGLVRGATTVQIAAGGVVRTQLEVLQR